jgi:Tol biopolymer transport system component/DNA-binding winged helix-turn-helix (wHTH) protein
MSTVEQSKDYEFGPYRLDSDNRLLLREGRPVPLSLKSYDLLVILVENRGKVLEKDKLMVLVWPGHFVEEANLSHHIYLLRKALGDDKNGNNYIETIPRRGYRFVKEVRELPSLGVAAEAPKTSSNATGSIDENADSTPTRSSWPSIHSSTSAVTELSYGGGGVGDSAATKSSPVTENLALPDKGLQSRPGSAAPFQLKRVWTTRGALLLAAMGILAIYFLFLGRRGDRTSDIDVYQGVTFLTTYSGQECQPALSLDGKQVAFTWNGDGPTNWDIYVKIIGTASLLRLTQHPGQDTSPAWSPDGRFVAYRRNTGPDSGFYIVPALGGVERKIASAFPVRVHHRGRNLDWTPEGKFLVVTDRKNVNEPFALFRVDIETGEKTQLTFPQVPCTGAMGLAISPDGKEVAFSSVNPNQTDHQRRFVDLYVVPMKGGPAERLTFDESMIVGMCWTPDSRGIVYSSYRNARSNGAWSNTLWKISRRGGEPRMVSQHLRKGVNPTISGNRLAYEERNVAPLRIWRKTLSLNGKNTAPAQLIVSSTRGEAFPQVSPDGKKIAFLSKRSGPFEIWVSDAEGLNAFPLTDFKNEDFSPPRWSPDSRSLVFSSPVAGTPDLYVVDLNERRPRRLTSAASAENLPSWSNDGQWIYYSSSQTGLAQIWKIPAAGGRAIQMTKNGGEESLESPDGKYLYFTTPKGLSWTFSESSLWRVSVDGGEATQVMDTIHVGHWGFLQDGIFYLDTLGREEVPFPIQFRRFRTGKTAVIGWIDYEPIWGGAGLSVAPDGRWMVFARRDRVEYDLMLIENLNLERVRLADFFELPGEWTVARSARF